jgi:uncharacterized DUF497 family protein
MDVEFDSVKDAINRDKHGVSLAFGAQVLDAPDHIVIPTVRIADEEERYKAVAHVDGRLWTAVFVYRNDGFRFISVRRSNHAERRIHDRVGGRSR